MDEKTRKPHAAGTPTADHAVHLSEQEEKLLHIIRESKDPAELLQVALETAADCLRRLGRSE